MNLKTVCLLAGVFCITLAMFTQGLLPMMEPQSRYKKVIRVVRTDLGELKWTEHTATNYTQSEALGRKVYIREGCWYCHSQYIRPVTGETRRWGPVTQSGEYAFDVPHLFSTRRIGPDLSRVGLKYGDEWHLAHFWDPRVVAPDSIMPRFAQLFEGPYGPVGIVDNDGEKTLAQNDDSKVLFNFSSSEKVKLTPNSDGLLFVPDEARGKYPVIWTPNKEFEGSQVTMVAQSEELAGLIAYVQKLGTNRGKWRDRFEPQTVQMSQISIPRSEEWIGYGKQVYERRCQGCHGEKGDGNGLAATFIYKHRPRNFNLAVFKFRRTPSGSLPTDGDLMRTIVRGVRGTAMPTWHMLPEKDRLAVIQYIKYELAVDRSDEENPVVYFEEEEVEPPIWITKAPEPSEEMVAQGKSVWQQAKCWECHGNNGQGDGEKAGELEDDFGFPIHPADLTTGQLKSGPLVADIYRTLSTGLMGTPMPSYADSFSEEDRWALAYYVVTLSAFKDPLSGKVLQISEADRRALNNPELKATHSAIAYKRMELPGSDMEKGFGGAAWASKKGFELDTGGDRKKKPNPGGATMNLERN